MRKQFSNQEILMYTEQLNKVFLQTDKDIDLPIKINFYLQKNIKTFSEAAQEINNLRLKIGNKYGEFDEETGAYIIKDKEKLKIAQSDMAQLLSIDQILNIHMISLSELEKEAKLTVAQMNAMYFMIDDDDDSDDGIVYIDEE